MCQCHANLTLLLWHVSAPFSHTFLVVSVTVHPFMYVSHLCVFSGEISVQILCPCFNWVIVIIILLLSCRGSICTLNMNPLSDICLAHIFSNSSVCFSLCWLFLLLCRSFLIWSLCCFAYDGFSCYIYLRDQCQSQCHGDFQLYPVFLICKYTVFPAKQLLNRLAFFKI